MTIRLLLLQEIGTPSTGALASAGGDKGVDARDTERDACVTTWPGLVRQGRNIAKVIPNKDDDPTDIDAVPQEGGASFDIEELKHVIESFRLENTNSSIVMLLRVLRSQPTRLTFVLASCV